MVVIKPQNVPCCPDESGDDNLLDKLKRYLCEKENAENKFVGLVHRLDRVTGGVMVYAKTSKAAARLGEQISGDGFEKTYLAIVCGTPKERAGTLIDFLYKNEIKNTVEIVPSATTGAKRAELSYIVSNKAIMPDIPVYLTKAQKEAQEATKQPKQKPTPDLSLVEIKLETGRSHQIRVQFAHIGCPIFGDAKYGGDKFGKGWNLALWAHKISFLHPTTGDKMSFIVNPPEDLPWNKFDFDRKGHKTR